MQFPNHRLLSQQMDMTAYVKPGTKERIGIIQDFVSPSLTEFVHRLIDEYNDIPSVQTACKYACSDHSSWTKIGVPSAFAIGKSLIIYIVLSEFRSERAGTLMSFMTTFSVPFGL